VWLYGHRGFESLSLRHEEIIRIFMTDEKKHQEVHTPVATPAPAPPVQPTQHSDEGLAVVSMVLGIISFTGPGLLTGIPAIITGAIALKKKQGSRGMSITGVVTGSVSTAFSLLVIAAIIWAFLWGWGQPMPTPQNQVEEQTPGQTEQFFNSRT
jgi:hypothetical protein